MAKQKKKKTIGDYFLTLILIAAIGVFCYAAFNLLHIFNEYKKGTDEYNQIAQMAVSEREPDKEPGSDKKKTGNRDVVDMQPEPPFQVDFEELKKINKDVIGWIFIEGMGNINYPIVKGRDNDQYLHTTYAGTYNFAGTIFIDYENSSDFSDCNTLVYGHNMKNGSMFGTLRRFVSDSSIYASSPYFWILTPEKNYRYEIISAYTTGVNSITYTLFKGPGAEFKDYLEKIVNYSEIKTNPGELTENDKLITLSTCTGDDSTRFVVQGKRVNETDAKPVSK